MRVFSRTFGMVLTALLVTFLWGSVAPAIKLGYQSLGIEAHQIGLQLLFAGHITLLAALVLFVFLLTNKQQLSLSFGHFWPVTKVAIFQVFLNYLFFFIGVSLSSGTIGAIMAGTTSFFQILFAHFLWKQEQLTWTKKVGLLIGLVGLIMLNVTNSFQWQIGWGDFFLFLSVLTGAWGNLLAKNLVTSINTTRMTAYAVLFSGTGLFVMGMSIVGTYPFSFSFRSTILLFYLGVMTATALLLWNLLMQRFPVGQVSLFLLFIPVFGVFISAIVLNEQLQTNAFVAFILIVMGIGVIHLPRMHN
ncbi:DMT family transporter [Shimazuella sp. AN120528]|uniref:DMT family transporter n=1 Tax=Shimazuella soli TaxID=1892854 RepID=UPI001F1009C7|nr:DMT family transporter [Shimazuella soli]MCH5583782.1 DMT family transporter [Shimazuella soli]